MENEQLNSSTSQSIEKEKIDEVCRENYEERLLKLLDEIKPDRLESTSHIKYVKSIKESIKTCLLYDSSFLLLLVKAVKECRQACYKREVLIEALDLIIFSDNILLTNLLYDPFQNSSLSSNIPWKELSNSIVALPDLIANCGALKKLPNFRPEEFYTYLLKILYRALSLKRESSACQETSWFHVQILGRIAISGFSQLVWDVFTSKIIQDKREEFKNNVAFMLTIPLNQDNQIVSSHFQIFIEPLYVPIFFSLTPTNANGRLIKSILSDKIISHSSFNYIICNKSILQKNYTHSRKRQNIILFNIFSYLSCLVKDKQEVAEQSLSSAKRKNKFSQLVETLLEVAECWSNSTRILFRSYEQNRYITCAFIVAFRYGLQYDKAGLLECAEKVHSLIIRGFSVYLNRASAELRNLIMCFGEIILPKLHQLIDEYFNRDIKSKNRENLDLNFDVNWDEGCLDMKRLFELEVDELFDGTFDDKKSSLKQSESNKNHSLNVNDEYSRTNTAEEKQSVVRSGYDKEKQAKAKLSVNMVNSVVKDKVEGKEGDRDENNMSVDNDYDNDDDDDEDDDLIPYNLEDIDANECDSDNGDVGEDCLNVPIYLRDCINGLAENNKPRYVRICLIKAGELIRSCLLEQEAMDDKRALRGEGGGGTRRRSLELQESYRASCNQSMIDYRGSVKAVVNDEIRDIALEMAQVLLYLDDQFHIENFDALRIKALSFLSVSAPDLVVKYLVDKFNEFCGSTRQQLDILQVLVASAQQLSSTSSSSIGAFSEMEILFGALSGNGDDDGGNDVRSLATAGKLTYSSKDNIQQRQQTVQSNRSKIIAGGAKIRGGAINKFVRYAPLYFYGIVHRLKANLDNSSLPISIVSAVKSALEDSTSGTAAKGETLIRRVLAGLAKTKSQLGSFEPRASVGVGGGSFGASDLATPIKAPIARQGSLSSRVVVIEEEEENVASNNQDNQDNDNDGHVKIHTNQSASSSSSSSDDAKLLLLEPEESKNKQSRLTHCHIGDGSELSKQKHKEDELDDSYLLSRILFSVSLIIKCLHQQPITCKLSNDLLDILAAYRDHPDLGVRASIIACLAAIRQCTPKVYFQEYLSEKTMCLSNIY